MASSHKSLCTINRFFWPPYWPPQRNVKKAGKSQQLHLQKDKMKWIHTSAICPNFLISDNCPFQQSSIFPIHQNAKQANERINGLLCCLPLVHLLMGWGVFSPVLVQWSGIMGALLLSPHHVNHLCRLRK